MCCYIIGMLIFGAKTIQDGLHIKKSTRNKNNNVCLTCITGLQQSCVYHANNSLTEVSST